MGGWVFCEMNHTFHSVLWKSCFKHAYNYYLLQSDVRHTGLPCSTIYKALLNYWESHFWGHKLQRGSLLQHVHMHWERQCHWRFLMPELPSKAIPTNLDLLRLSHSTCCWQHFKSLIFGSLEPLPKIGDDLEDPLEFKAPSFKTTGEKHCFFQNVAGREESGSSAVSFNNKEK